MAPRSPIDRRTLALRFREASRHDEAAFAQYGVNAVRRARILTNFAEWATELDPPPPESSQWGSSTAPSPHQ